MKFKQKMRLVSGLRQCTNGVRSGRALLVLLAPDTEVAVSCLPARLCIALVPYSGHMLSLCLSPRAGERGAGW